MKFNELKEFKNINIEDMEYLNLYKKELTSLEGCPPKVKNFSCSNNNLTSLKFSPKIVKGNFYCSYNNLTSLEYSPTVVLRGYFCSNNKLISLKGSPEKIIGDFSCSYNKLKTLSERPKEINGIFDCSNNNLETLEDCPKLIKKYLNCKNNPELKNAKDQIIKYQIKAQKYYTDEGDFTFEDIKEEFEKYKEVPLKIKKNIFINDFGYGI